MISTRPDPPLVQACLAVGVLVATCMSSPASAAPSDRTPPRTPDDRSPAVDDPAEATEQWAVTGRAERIRHLVPSHGLHVDPAAFRSVARTRVVGPLTVRAEASDLGPAPAFAPEVALQTSLLGRRARKGDIVLSGGWEAQGFNLTPAVVSRILLSRTMGRTRILGQLAYAQAVDSDERYGDVRWTLARALPRQWLMGMDARARMDLERDADEPTGEQDWEVFAGPMAYRTVGPVVIGASAGIFATRLRLVGPVFVGAEATMSVGTPF